MATYRRKPKVKLLTLWEIDSKFQDRNVDTSYISHGIWETQGVEEKLNSGKLQRIYTLVCVSPQHPRLLVGTKRKMDEIMIVELCHRIKIVRVPKYKSLMKRNVTNN